MRRIKSMDLALIIINWNIWDQQSKQSSMQRQLEVQHQQIQALKARLTALETRLINSWKR